MAEFTWRKDAVQLFSRYLRWRSFAVGREHGKAISRPAVLPLIAFSHGSIVPEVLARQTLPKCILAQS